MLKKIFLYEAFKETGNEPCTTITLSNPDPIL